MLGYNDKINIKTPKILQKPSFWTFLTFLIILMVTKYPRNYFYVLLWSQGFQKGIICGVTISKPLSRHSKSSLTLVFWTFLTFLIILMVTKYPRNYSYVLPWSQGFQKGIICRVIMSKPPLRHSKSSKIPVFGCF